MVRCYVKGCLRKYDKNYDHSFFLWPKNERIRQQWKDFAQYEGFSSNLRICADHFERRYIKKNTPPKRLLVPNAVPTLLSPDNMLRMTKTMPKPPLINSTAGNALENVNNDEIIFERPALKDECSHNDKGIIFEVRKATDNEPALINIETNSFVKISLRDKQENEKSREPQNLEAEILATDCEEPKSEAAETVLNTVEAELQNDTIVPILSTNAEEPKCKAALEKLPFNSVKMQNLNISSEAPVQCSTPKKKIKYIRKFTLSRCETPRRVIGSPKSVASSKVRKFLTPKSLRLQTQSRIIARCETPRRVIGSPKSVAFSKVRKFLTPKSLRLQTQSRTIARLRSQVYRNMSGKKLAARKNVKQDVQSIINASSNYLGKEALVLFATQLRLSVKKKYARRYSNEVKDIALSIKYHSPKTYKLLQTFLHLPTIRTLNEYQRSFPTSPGLHLTVLDQLKENFANSVPQDRLVSVLFDEISLATEVHYDAANDMFHGYADDGVERTNEIAHCALVAMITWINKPMKQTIGYWFLGKKGNSAKTHKIMVHTINKLNETGLIVKCLICDQGTRNTGLMKKYKITKDKPFFEFMVGDEKRKIYLIFDPPHLIKSFRNNLFNKRFKYRGGYVDWKLIYKVYLLSNQMKINFIPKINDRHFGMQQNAAKMTVSLATQFFSNSMYLAYRAYSMIKPDEFDGPDKDTTAEFLLDMDKLFDSLNSNLLQPTVESKLNFAITETSGHIKFLNEMLIHFADSKFEKKDEKQKAIPPCITGMMLTINSVLKLSEELRKEYNFPALKTRRLNQDPLENLFAVIRQQNGCSVNPSTRSFETAIKQNFITQLTKVSESANCQDDRNMIFAKLRMLNTAIAKPQKSQHQQSVPEDSVDASNTIEEIEKDMTLTETASFTHDNAIYYICGYLTRKFLNIHNKCQKCVDIVILPKSDNNYQEYKLFTIMKDYADKNGLQYSTEIVFTAVQKWNTKFEEIIRNCIHKKNISAHLYSKLSSLLPAFQLCSLDATKLFLDIFIKVRCYWEARFIRRDLKKTDTETSKKKNKRKLSKFANSATEEVPIKKSKQSEDQKEEVKDKV